MASNPHLTFSSMNSLLHMRVHRNELSVQLWVLVDHDRGIERSRNEDGIDTAGDGRDEDLANLQADEEGESDNNRGEASIIIVGRVGEDKVQVCEECAGVGYEGGAHGQDRTDEALVDEGVDAAVLDEPERR